MILDLVLVDSPMMTDVWRTREPFEWEGRKIWVLAMNRRLPTPAERALCRTAQLRDLSRRLQRAKERSERERLLAQFEVFRLAIAEGHAPARRTEIPPTQGAPDRLRGLLGPIRLCLYCAPGGLSASRRDRAGFSHRGVRRRRGRQACGRLSTIGPALTD